MIPPSENADLYFAATAISALKTNREELNRMELLDGTVTRRRDLVARRSTSVLTPSGCGEHREHRLVD